MRMGDLGVLNGYPNRLEARALFYSSDHCDNYRIYENDDIVALIVYLINNFM